MFRVNSTLPAPMIVTLAMIGSVAGVGETDNIAQGLRRRSGASSGRLVSERLTCGFA